MTYLVTKIEPNGDNLLVTFANKASVKQERWSRLDCTVPALARRVRELNSQHTPKAKTHADLLTQNLAAINGKESMSQEDKDRVRKENMQWFQSAQNAIKARTRAGGYERLMSVIEEYLTLESPCYHCNRVAEAIKHRITATHTLRSLESFKWDGFLWHETPLPFAIKREYPYSHRLSEAEKFVWDIDCNYWNVPGEGSDKPLYEDVE